MTVAELIALLQTMSPDQPVVVSTSQYTTDSFQIVWNDDHVHGKCAMIEVFDNGVEVRD